MSKEPVSSFEGEEKSNLEEQSVADKAAAAQNGSSQLDGTPKDVTPAEDGAIDDTVGYPSGLKLLALIFALCLVVFLVALDQTIIATAIPRITDHFNSIDDIGWYGSAYFLTSTSLQPSYGRLYKVFSVKIVFLISIFIFELGSLICGVAPSSTALVVGRAVAGMGVGGIFSGALVIIAHSLPLHKRPMVFGAVGGMWGLASVAGPLLGGAFTQHLSWRWCFYINLPIGAVSVVLVILYLHIPRSPRDSEKGLVDRVKELDLIGASILIPGVICLLLAVQWGGNAYPWKNSRIIGLFIGAGLILILFIFSQIRLGEKATLPPRIFKQRTVAASAGYVFFFGCTLFVLMYYLPLYLQAVKGSSPTRAGIQVLPFMLSSVVASIIAGAYVTIAGYYTPFLICASALMIVGAGLVSTFDTNTPSSKWVGYQIIVGLGAGVGFNIPLVAIQTVLSMEDIPIGTVSVMFFQTLGGALFLAVGQAVFQNGLIAGVKKYVPELDPRLLVNTGATAIRGALQEIGREDLLDQVLKAYVSGLKNTFRVVIATAIVATLFTLLFEWKTTKKEKSGNGNSATVNNDGIA